MKNQTFLPQFSIFFLSIILGLFYSCQQSTNSTPEAKPLTAQSTISVEEEEDAIKQVIANETKFFYEGNPQKWAACYVHESYLYWSVTPNTGEVYTFRGWENWKKQAEEWMKEAEPNQDNITQSDWNIVLKNNLALVSYIQHVESEKNKTKFDVFETRIMEKVDGEWKIAMLTAIADFKNATPPQKSNY